MRNPNVILVTGGAGFIGSAVVRALIAGSEASVVNLDKLTYAGNLDSLSAALDSPRHFFRQADVADQNAVRNVFDEFQPRAVIHLAAETHVDRSIDGPREFVVTNVLGTCVMLEESLRFWKSLSGAAATEFCFIHVSTDEVFGSLGADGAFSEASSYEPNSPYAASKAGSDHLVRAWHQTYGLPVIISNCSNNFGPYQFPEKLIPLTIHHALAGRPIPVYGAGTNVRDWLYVEDHVQALRLILQSGSPGEVYTIGGRSERANIDVVRALCRILDELVPDPAIGPREGLIQFVADRPGHDQRYAIDPTKIERDLGWRAVHTFEDGLRATVCWYLDNIEWRDRVLSGAYRGERIGLGAER